MINYFLMKRGYKKIYTLDEIKVETCIALGINIEDISSRSRKRELVDARKIYCHISKYCVKESLTSIGSKIDRHHSNVIHLIDECKNLNKNNREFRTKYFKVRSRISL